MVPFIEENNCLSPFFGPALDNNLSRFFGKKNTQVSKKRLRYSMTSVASHFVKIASVLPVYINNLYCDIIHLKKNKKNDSGLKKRLRSSKMLSSVGPESVHEKINYGLVGGESNHCQNLQLCL